MTSILKKACVGVCGMLVIPFLAMSPVRAAETPAPAPTAVAPETAPVETPTVTTFKASVPDDNFRKYINETFFGGVLKDDEQFTVAMQKVLGTYTSPLDVSGKEIVNLKGVEYFTGITVLDCSHNNLQLLDISQMKNLTKLDVSYNNLSDITFAQDNVLKDINCSNNNLILLNLAAFTNVEKLDCSNNMIATLNLNGLYKLKWLDCSDNVLATLGVEGMVALEELYCDGNGLVNLDIATLKNLKVLENKKSVLTLKVQSVSGKCGVVLPVGAVKPATISNSGTYVVDDRAIVWDKVTSVPASFTYTYMIPGTTQTSTVTVVVDKTEFAEKAVKLSKVDTLTIASSAYNKVKLTWSGVDGATGYRIYRSTSKTSGFKKIKSITTNSKVTYTNSGISCGTTYYYRVRAYRLIDGIYYFGEYSPVVAGKPVPAKPGSLSVAKYSRKKVKLSWNKVAGASGYRIYRSKSKSSGFSKIKTITSGSKLTYTKTTARKVKYYYKIRAYRTVNGKKVWGAYSSVKGKTLS